MLLRFSDGMNQKSVWMLKQRLEREVEQSVDVALLPGNLGGDEPGDFGIEGGEVDSDVAELAAREYLVDSFRR